ncbi:MAG: hypothetical protein V3W45_06850 [Sedimentisphaerales bacterium]
MKRRKNLHLPKSDYESTSTAKWCYLPLLALVILSSFIAIMRLHTYEEPVERDIGNHAVIAHEILQGRKLYSDLWDSKPPAIFVTYAVADAIVGYGPGSVYLVGVVAAIITLLGVYWAGSAHGGVPGGLWAAAFWTFICSDLWLWANQPNTEVGMNTCLVWAFALIVRANTKKLQIWRWLVIGGLFAIATLYKPVAITFAAFLSCFYLLANIRHSSDRKTAFFQICLIAAAGAAVWGVVFAYFAATNRFTVFYDTIFKYGRWYAKSRGSNIFENICEGFSYEKLFCRYMKSTPVLVIFTAAGIILGLWKGCRRYWLLLLGFALAAPFAVALPGRFYGHYYQLWLGPLVVGAGWALTTLGPKGKLGPVRDPTAKVSNGAGVTLARSIVGAVGLIILLLFVLPQYKFSADEWSAKKQGPQYIFSKQVAFEVNKLLEPDEAFYVLGITPEMYFWSKRRPPTGVIWSTDMVDNPLAKEHTARALEDLEREKPEIFVINMLYAQVPRNHPVVVWAEKQYIPLPGNPNRGPLRYGNQQRFLFRIFILRDGKLASRLGL